MKTAFTFWAELSHKALNAPFHQQALRLGQCEQELKQEYRSIKGLSVIILTSGHWKRSCPVQVFHQTCVWICRRLKRCTVAGVSIWRNSISVIAWLPKPLPEHGLCLEPNYSYIETWIRGKKTHTSREVTGFHLRAELYESYDICLFWLSLEGL